MSQLLNPGEARIKAVAAAQAVWRVSNFRGFDPVLRTKVRHSASDVMVLIAGLGFHSGSAAERASGRLLAAIAGLESLLELARGIGAISDENVRRLRAAYARLRELKTPALGPAILGKLDDRQRKIVFGIAFRGTARLADIHDMFGASVSGKTLQRELSQLLSAGLIRRKGGNRWASYSIGSALARDMPGAGFLPSGAVDKA